MFQFLEWLAGATCFGLFIYKWIIIAAVVMTWVSADPHNQIVRWIGRVTRPLWVWCEQRMPGMMAHFSAYASILVVIFAQMWLSEFSYDLICKTEGAFLNLLLNPSTCLFSSLMEDDA